MILKTYAVRVRCKRLFNNNNCRIRCVVSSESEYERRINGKSPDNANSTIVTWTTAEET